MTGRIAGLGSTSGTRVVIGRWDTSPIGQFADAMVEHADGHRLLFAPTEVVADYVSTTYTFDEIRVEPVTVAGSHRWVVDSSSLRVEFTLGARMPLGRLLHATPRALSTRPAVTLLTDPVARILMRGVRTRGTAGGHRREYYAATDIHAITSLSGSIDGVDLGGLAPVDPPCRFGFSSTPRRPAVTSVTTTILVQPRSN